MNRLRCHRKKDRAEDSSFTVQQAGLMVVVFLALALTLQAQPPWWTATGGPLNSNPANDYAVANQGQLKQFTEKAVQYLDTNLSGGAGTTLDSMVAGWSNFYATNGYSSTNPAPSDLKAINQGQLKYIGNLVWTNLITAGYTNAMPTWLSSTNADDYHAVNIGQLKTIFNFDLTDSDENGLYDWWEMQYFGHLGNNPFSSPTGNGVLLRNAYTYGADPTNYYSQIDWTAGTAVLITPVLGIVSGNNQVCLPGAFTDDPLIVSVTDSSLNPLVNAPVTFSVTAGGGQISASSGGTTVTSLSLTTDGSGHAQVYYQHVGSYNVTSTVHVTAASQSTNFTESTSPGDGTFDAPSNITMSSHRESEIDLTWVNHASLATSIIIEQSTDQAHWSHTATLTDPTATSYAVTGLTIGQTYYFRIYGSN